MEERGRRAGKRQVCISGIGQILFQDGEAFPKVVVPITHDIVGDQAESEVGIQLDSPVAGGLGVQIYRKIGWRGLGKQLGKNRAADSVVFICRLDFEPMQGSNPSVSRPEKCGSNGNVPWVAHKQAAGEKAFSGRGIYGAEKFSHIGMYILTCAGSSKGNAFQSSSSSGRQKSNRKGEGRAEYALRFGAGHSINRLQSGMAAGRAASFSKAYRPE